MLHVNVTVWWSRLSPRPRRHKAQNIGGTLSSVTSFEANHWRHGGGTSPYYGVACSLRENFVPLTEVTYVVGSDVNGYNECSLNLELTLVNRNVCRALYTMFVRVGCLVGVRIEVF